MKASIFSCIILTAVVHSSAFQVGGMKSLVSRKQTSRIFESGLALFQDFSEDEDSSLRFSESDRRRLRELYER